MIPNDLLNHAIELNVRFALEEDIGAGDITARLIPANQSGHARVISREPMIIAGKPWVNALFQALDPSVQLEWRNDEGDLVQPDSPFLYLHGPARSLLSGERPALNFLQTLSGTATKVRDLVGLLDGTRCQLLDTRKTIPGLRIAQKYAVSIGGGRNHRLGLFDAFLIKENHIMAAGGITAAILSARCIAPEAPVEVEVENLRELENAVTSGADIIMLDNFSMEDMHTAVSLNAGRAKLEASGNIGRHNMRAIAKTGVDYISMGSLTKDVKAIDLSMRFTD
ncbi:MAG: carboxylating nicotinate-nucleotide diphosphorylase [Fluviicoccus sp.]|uniref:carboxylating nicotinate-nucleotide diphosphorylase n=1 Tax=Fluviicoccus sp. TaxID=2003552 RepID=UPI002717F415|nr:carboxylating nicotinate-nucleotide diphosphorylase [Fluviicoccus sp.]MDO8330688.1 carboxylating nicotinate-nucleotide diphosphorylase [Fluviicoccus sp.]